MAYISDREAQLRQLLILATGGDSRAYRQFLEELANQLRGFLSRRLSSLPNEVEDLVQELLLAIHNQRHTYDPSRPVTVWVQAIARYKLVDLLRRRKRLAGLHVVFDETDEVFGHCVHESVEAQLDVAALLARLPDRQRLPIQYVKVEGASVADAAARTGMSVSAVKVGIHRGLKVLSSSIRKSS